MFAEALAFSAFCLSPPLNLPCLIKFPHFIHIWRVPEDNDSSMCVGLCESADVERATFSQPIQLFLPFNAAECSVECFAPPHTPSLDLHPLTVVFYECEKLKITPSKLKLFFSVAELELRVVQSS